MAFEVSLKMQEADADDPESMAATISQLKNLALTMQRLEQSATINVKREADIRKQEREQALQDAAKTAVSEVKKNGLSDEAADQIRRKILGIT